MSPRAMKAYERASSLRIESVWVAEHRELDDVAAEEERGRPVGDDAQLPREERQLVKVVRPRDEPAEEAGEAEADHVGDALVTAERGHLAEHSVAVGLPLADEVLGEAAGLAERVLRGGRIDVARRGGVGDRGSVADRPDMLVPVDPQRLVHLDAAALVEREPELREHRIRL